ncbi:MAG: alpha/beta hydrolase [Deltaproteobacteria bacterium]|nr:alpha/beta hydrolase [Deltaproteobacteria bacterium]
MRPFQQLPYADVPDVPRLPHRYFETAQRHVLVPSRHFGEVGVHTRTHGRGPPLVLIHGFMTTSYSWRYMLDLLGAHFTLHLPDLVGAGRSDKPDRSYGPEELASFIGEWMRAAGVHGAPVLGNSLGGYLSMRLALQDPKAISRLVNLHSPGLPTGRMWALKVLSSLIPFKHEVVRGLVWRDPARWVHKNVHYFDESLKSRQEHTEYAAPLRTSEGVRAFSRMLFETVDVSEMSRFRERLRALGGKFPIPLQLLYADRDPMVPPAVGDTLHALLPQAEFVRISHTSHFAHVDTPALVAEKVLPFFQRKE